MADEKPAESTSSNKWWEQYYVRYFVGTVVGAAILLALFRSSTLAVELQLTFPPDLIGGWGVAAISAAGLGYCYIASAPILVVHAIRGGLIPSNSRGSVLFATFLSAFLGILLVACVVASRIGGPSALAWSLTVAIFLLQCVAIVVAQRDRFAKVTSFYDRLIEARKIERDKGTDYRDSYRHLREHGNAKSIILLEIVLGVILADVSSVRSLVQNFLG